MTLLSSRRRPDKSEYAEYYDRYVRLVPEGDIVEYLASQRDATLALLRGTPPGKVEFRYAPGKWALRDVVRHFVDMEWVFTYRALSFARYDAPPLPGVDQEQFMTGATFAGRGWPDLLEEFHHLRSANILLFAGFDDARWDRGGVASDNRVTTRALSYIIAGHVAHHMAVLKEKYLA